MTTAPKFIIVVGTSAGGIRALEELVLQLDPGIDAAILVVLHLSRKGVGEVLLQRIQNLSPLFCKIAEHKEVIKKGFIYFAPPDEHLVVEDMHMLVGRGAPENRWRPSINNLFRSAAVTFNSRVIGIILTGLLDDGTVGMSAIKRCGGRTIVQNPDEADHPDMPLSVIREIDVDFIESLSKMGPLLRELTSGPMPAPHPVPQEFQTEVKIDQRVSMRLDDLARFEKIQISCPDCGGGLYATVETPPKHFRCHVGHSYSERELLIRVSEVMENTFWISLRMMEERRTLLAQLAQKDRERGYKSSADIYDQRAKEMEIHIENLKQILFTATQVD